MSDISIQRFGAPGIEAGTIQTHTEYSEGGEPRTDNHEAVASFVREPGWYVHSGRVFVQGAIDLAPAPGSRPGGTTTVSGTLLKVPPAFAPKGAAKVEEGALPPLALIMDPYWTTPSFQGKAVLARWKKGGGKLWELELPGVLVPNGSYGEMRLIISSWWDSDGADNPGGGPNEPFNAQLDYADGSGPIIAHKGSRVWLDGQLIHVKETAEPTPSQPDRGRGFLEEGADEELLHKSAPLGPHDEMREIASDFPPMPSLERPDFFGYTVARALSQGLVPVHVDRRTLFDELNSSLAKSNDAGEAKKGLSTGVLPTDRYTFYDVCPIVGVTEPQLGAYGGPFPRGLGSPTPPEDRRAGLPESQNTDSVFTLSGPTSGTGMSVFVGDVGPLGYESYKPLSIYLGVPQGAGGPGHGYYRFDLFDKENAGIPPLFRYDPIGPLREEKIGERKQQIEGEEVNRGQGKTFESFQLLLEEPFFGPNASEIFEGLAAGALGGLHAGSPFIFNEFWETFGHDAPLGSRCVFNTVMFNPNEVEEFNEPPEYFGYVNVLGDNETNRFIAHPGWAWFDIPRGKKSVLISVTSDRGEVEKLKEEWQKQTGGAEADAEGLTEKQLENVTTMLIFEWGEVGLLPHESRKANRGRVVMPDPTPVLSESEDSHPTTYPEPKPPEWNIFVVAGSLFQLSFILAAFGGLGILTKKLIEPLIPIWENLRIDIIWGFIWSLYDTHLIAWAEYEFEVSKIRSANTMKSYGDAAIRIQDGENNQTYTKGVPIWVGTYPLPPWKKVNPGEAIDLMQGGYADFPKPEEELAVGGIAEGVVFKD